MQRRKEHEKDEKSAGNVVVLHHDDVCGNDNICSRNNW